MSSLWQPGLNAGDFYIEWELPIEMKPDSFLFMYVVKGTNFAYHWTGFGGIKTAQRDFANARRYVFEAENIERLNVSVFAFDTPYRPVIYSRYIMKKPEPVEWEWVAVTGYPEDKLS